jgi:Zn-finger nucleic acid-binding protein
MYCPICKGMSLHKAELETGLMALECSKCNGKWVQSYQYWLWRDKQGKSLPDGGVSACAAELHTLQDVRDSKNAKLCPECGHFLRRYPVGHGIDFQIDRCSNCGGMWFDANEWEILVQQGMHDDVHRMFSAIWQGQVLKEQKAKSMREHYLQKFGPADFQKACEIRAWLQGHKLSSELFAFISDKEKLD